MFFPGLSADAFLCYSCSAHTQHIQVGSFTRANGHCFSYDRKLLDQIPNAGEPFLELVHTHTPGLFEECMFRARP